MNKKAIDYSIFLLSKTDYSKLKIKQKLTAKGYQQEEISHTIEKLISLNYLREEEYKNLKIKSMLLRGYATSYIQKKLKQEEIYINENDINFVCTTEGIDRLKIINKLVKQKIDGKHIPTTFELKMKFKNKILYYLSSKGYSFEDSHSIIEDYL